jgi:hypothetical protein
MDLRLRILQWLLWFVAVSHLVIGGGAFLSRGFQVQMPVTQLDAIEQVFGIPAWRTVGNAAFFGALGVALLVLPATIRRAPAEAT